MKHPAERGGRGMENLRYDIVIIGGGVSGACAAVAASRCGARTALIERSDILGGMATLALVNPLQTFHAPAGQVIRGLAQEIVDDLIPSNGCLGHVPDPIGFATTLTPVNPVAFQQTLVKKCRDANVDIFFNHTFREAVLAPEGEIRTVTAIDADGAAMKLEAAVFVDAGGNGDLTLAAGAPMELDPDHQPMSLLFILQGVRAEEIVAFQKQNPGEFHQHPDTAVLDAGYVAVSGFFSAVARARESGELSVPRDRLLFFNTTRCDEVVVNTTRITGVTGLAPAELEAARELGMKQVRELAAFMKRDIPGFQDSSIKTVAREPGVRETRRLLGRLILNEHDLIKARQFDDVIAKGAYPMDIHQQTGEGIRTLHLEGKQFYDIPLRALLNNEVPNLITVGKCMSVTHEGFSSTRVMPTCMAVGQAGGVAAAAACKDPLGDIAEKISHIQKTLLDQNAVLHDEQVTG